jgi:DNA repair exonuclease SbcCD nuclease subunit
MRRFFSCLDDVITKTSPDFIIMAGDVFERLDTTNAERQLLSDWLGHIHIPVLAISGNHDKRTQAVGDTCLSYLSSLKLQKHVIYDGEPCVLQGLGCNFILFPYQGWANHDVQLMLEVLVEKARESQGPVIVVMHEPIAGCFDDSGMPITRRNQIEINDGDFDVDYWALGDMHRVQKLFYRCYYSGAPHQTRFSDHPEKGVLLVDTDSSSDPDFIPLSTPPLIRLDSVPDVWPDAFITLNTTETVDHLPDNVEYQSVILNVHRDSPSELIGILDGLEVPLQRSGLRADLQPRAITLAENMLKKAMQ